MASRLASGQAKRQLEHLAGKFNWAYQSSVWGGGTFLCRILHTINHLAQPSAKYQLTSAFYADIQ